MLTIQQIVTLYSLIIYNCYSYSHHQGIEPKQVFEWRSNEAKSLAKSLKLETNPLLIRVDVESSVASMTDDPHSNAIVLEHPKHPTRRAIIVLSSQAKDIALEDLCKWRTIGLGKLHRIFVRR